MNLAKFAFSLLVLISILIWVRGAIEAKKRKKVTNNNEKREKFKDLDTRYEILTNLTMHEKSFHIFKLTATRYRSVLIRF